MPYIPSELIVSIYEFNPEHRELFTNTLNEIPLKGILMRFSILAKIYDKHYITRRDGLYNNFGEVVAKYIDDPLHCVTVFSKCKCCLRHQIMRPLTETPHEARILGHMPNNWRDCECNCRHYSRWVMESHGLWAQN